MITIRQVCDGWDARAVTSTGESITLHFRAEPTQEQVAEAVAQYEASQIPPEPEWVIECEDGTNA